MSWIQTKCGHCNCEVAPTDCPIPLCVPCRKHDEENDLAVDEAMADAADKYWDYHPGC